MGADLEMFSVPYLRDGFTPNWQAGYDKIDQIPEEGDRDYTRGHLDDFKEMFEGKFRRDVTVHEVGPYDVILTGGMTWGDTPTEFCDTICALSEYGILDAVGFYDTVNWYKLFNLVLEKAGTEVLPLLIGLDPDLDKIVKEKLKGE